MDAVIVTLIITMTVAGHDIERHENIKSLSECWDRAKETMEEIRKQHSETVPIKKIGIGCVIDMGNPA